jgi:hypothetical protein
MRPLARQLGKGNPRLQPGASQRRGGQLQKGSAVCFHLISPHGSVRQLYHNNGKLETIYFR